MSSVKSISIVWTVLIALFAAPSLAVTEVTGTTPSGAAYRVAVPDGWQPGGPLVLVQRGYVLDQVARPDLGELLEVQLAQGFAVAASGYRTHGWGLAHAMDDNAELLDAFSARFGAPGTLHATGRGMGGLTAVKLSEDPRFRDRTEGVLATCPVLADTEFWESIQDLRVMYDALCTGVANGSLPVGDAPYPWATNRSDIPIGLPALEPANAGSLIEFLPQVRACTGLGLAPGSRTGSQATRLANLKQLTSVSSEDALVARLAYAAFALGDLVRAPGQLALRNPLFNEVQGLSGTRGISYGGPSFDAGVRRIRRSDPFAYFDFQVVSRPEGTADARLLIVGSRDDELAAIEHQEFFQDFYPADARRLNSSIVESSAGHCAFSPAELRGAWGTLIGPRFDRDTPHALCTTAAILGTSGPCRFADPPARDGLEEFRARRAINPPRNADGWRLTSSGLWFDPARDGEGIVIEEMGEALGHETLGTPDRRKVLVSWYTFAPPGDPDPGPRWLIGIGLATGEGVHVPSLTMTRGARFGDAFRPADVQRVDWGSLDVVPDAAHRLHVRYDGPPGWEGAPRTMQFLAQVDLPVNMLCCIGTPPAPPRPTVASASGSYFHPSRDGEGIQLQVLASPAGSPRRATVIFYTYDADGRQLWLTGVAENVPATGGDVVFEVTRASGGVFGDAFDPAAIQRTPWGTVTVTLFREPPTSEFDYNPWRATQLRWASTQAGFAAGGYPLQRLTQAMVHFYN